MTELLWSDDAIRARGKIPRMGTLQVERRSGDALAVAEDIAELMHASASVAPDAPGSLRFRLNHATLLLRRGRLANGGLSDAERARMLIESALDEVGIRRPGWDPAELVRADDMRTRELPTLLLALNGLGEHKRAADLFERVMDLHASPSTRFHVARLNAGRCRTAHALAAWAGGNFDQADVAIDRAIALLSAEVTSAAAHLAGGDDGARADSQLLRESNLLDARLLRLVLDGRDEASLATHITAVNELLDRSERNPGTAPVSLVLRYGRLADALTELAIATSDRDPSGGRAYASAALVYFAPRRELWRLDNDVPLSLVIRWARASELAGDARSAVDLLARGRTHLAARYGEQYVGLHLIDDRLRKSRALATGAARISPAASRP